jgi:hypothetical protein
MYVAGVDPSGGGSDAFTLAIVHNEGQDKVVQDVMRGWSSNRSGVVDLAAVCGEIATVIKRYGLYRVSGDHYAARWVSQAFQRVGVFYEPYEKDKSAAYRELEPWMAQHRIELLDHPVMLRELRLLEKRHRAGGKPAVIDHPKGGHDDHANALAVAVAVLARTMSPACGVFAPEEDSTIPFTPPQDRPFRDLVLDGDVLEGGRRFYGRGFGGFWR